MSMPGRWPSPPSRKALVWDSCFIPLQVVAFATCAAMARPCLVIRNVGSALGISISSFLLAQTTQIMHARIVEVPTPFNRMLQNGGAYLFWNSATAPGRAALNAEVTRQASIIAYVNDFKFMFVVCFSTACLLLLLRRPPASSADTVKHAAIE
jgi:DHA2 family multidrug resistance protein